MSNQAAHSHVFLGAGHDRNARRVWLVIGLTASMMVAEIAAGTIFGSMALVADGWHMSTHAGAMLFAALAYHFARREAHNPRFTFGTGKIGTLRPSRVQSRWPWWRCSSAGRAPCASSRRWRSDLVRQSWWLLSGLS